MFRLLSATFKHTKKKTDQQTIGVKTKRSVEKKKKWKNKQCERVAIVSFVHKISANYRANTKKRLNLVAWLLVSIENCNVQRRKRTKQKKNEWKANETTTRKLNEIVCC